MVLRKKKIVIDGKEMEVDVFDTKIIPGSGKEIHSVEKLLREEKIENAIQYALKDIENVAKKYSRKKRNIWYYYEIGKILQFVDEKKFVDVKGLIWERMAGNLRPDLFSGKKTPPKKAKAYPEIMYLLAKQKKEYISNITWSHWFEILQYHKIYNNTQVLRSLLQECEKKQLSSEKLRKRVQEENKKL